MVLEVPEHLGFDFLVKLHERVEKFIEKQKMYGAPAQDDYGDLKQDRHRFAFGILGLDIRNNRLRNIAWAGMYEEWDRYCRGNQFGMANQLEERCYRQLDVFLMPPGWQNSEDVQYFLPNWVSARPWAIRSFYKIMTLQARMYNPETRHFDKRVKGNYGEEKHILESLKEEEGSRKYSG